MNLFFRTSRIAICCSFAIAAASCATSEPVDYVAEESQWAANGWLNPGRAGEPEIIGLYATRRACERAVREWMSRQVVGNPVDGECLPIDRR